MNDAGFARAQAAYDAMEPPEYDEAESRPVDLILEDLLAVVDAADEAAHITAVHRLGDRLATVCLWIDGHEYSLTLNRED